MRSFSWDAILSGGENRKITSFPGRFPCNSKRKILGNEVEVSGKILLDSDWLRAVQSKFYISANCVTAMQKV